MKNNGGASLGWTSGPWDGDIPRQNQSLIEVPVDSDAGDCECVDLKVWLS